MNEVPYAERRFELDGGELPVRFFVPSKASGGEFQCRYVIGWPDQAVGGYACGEDGIQALMLAMRKVHSDLIESDAYKAGHLTWLDQADLDLPPTWGIGPLYDPPRS
jgi:hypothetical protein